MFSIDPNSLLSCFKLAIVVVVLSLFMQIECLNFSYPTFNSYDRNAFNFSYGSDIFLNAIQVTRDVRADVLYNTSGRALYRTKFKLWSDKKNMSSSFNSTFVMNITPQTKPGGEGLTFLLTKDDILPENSEGQWLGFVNSSSNGSSLIQTVGIEFDTKKSYVQDLDGDHVGIDINSIYSIQHVSLLNHDVNLSSGTDVTATILYNRLSKKLDVLVFMTVSNNSYEENTKNPIISMNLALHEYLPEDVFIGFSASTGQSTQLNCVRSWYFSSTHIFEEHKTNRLWHRILFGSISTFIITLLCIIACVYRRNKARKVQRENKKEKYPGIEQELQISTSSPQKYQLKQLIAATDNFNEKSKLGEGGFGAVYKGLLDNKDVAVKRVSQHSKQGKQEFLSEVKTISNLHHKNLVKLIGWCYEKNELLLVYEFMPNGSLEKYIILSKDSNSTTTLNWVHRVGIIHGVVQALDYLHNGCEKRVLHRDIKLSNIMLDSDFNAKLGDFGLARTLLVTEKTHHSTKEIAGTPGYIAPEFFHTGRASTEIDVYAFGILLLETVCGKKPSINHQIDQNVYVNGIVEMVWEFYRNEKITEVIDERVDGEYQQEEAECVLMLGLSCCHPNPNERPSMRSVLQVLVGEAYPAELPFEKPAFMWPANSPAALSFSTIDGSSVSGTKLSLFSQISGR